MPQLNRDILREIFYEIAEKDGFDRSMDKFMMAGKEPFNLVLDICKKAKDVVILKNKIIAKLPHIECPEPTINENYNDSELPDVTGTAIYDQMLLFKPISIAIASTLTSLDIRGFSPKLNPMLKSIDREMEEVNIRYNYMPLMFIFEACVNIPNVQNGVTVDFCQNYYYGIKSFAFRCHELKLTNARLHTMSKEINFYNPHLHNIRDLTIDGLFEEYWEFFKELEYFAALLSFNFPNLETLNVLILTTKSRSHNLHDWNDAAEMANFFKCLSPRIQGCICFKIICPRFLYNDPIQYPGVQRGNDEYYKIVPITDTLTFKMSYAHEH